MGVLNGLRNIIIRFSSYLSSNSYYARNRTLKIKFIDNDNVYGIVYAAVRQSIINAWNRNIPIRK